MLHCLILLAATGCGTEWLYIDETAKLTVGEPDLLLAGPVEVQELRPGDEARFVSFQTGCLTPERENVTPFVLRPGEVWSPLDGLTYTLIRVDAEEQAAWLRVEAAIEVEKTLFPRRLGPGSRIGPAPG